MMNSHDIFLLVVVGIIGLMGIACLSSVIAVIFAFVKNIWISIVLTIPVASVIAFLILWWFDRRNK